MSNDVFYPQERMNPTVGIAKTYRALISYTKGFIDYLSEPTISLKSLQDLLGILCFYLINQEEELKRGPTKLKLKYTLFGGSNAGFTLYAVILQC